MSVFTPTVIAIDGPTASGKGTLARRVAQHYGFDWLDTGLLYRAVGLSMLDRGLNLASTATAVQAATELHDNLHRHLDDPRLRSDAAGMAASKIAAIPPLREVLLDLQRNFATTPPGGKGAVLDGRDIGTVICPDAPVKLFVTAAVEIRARRRWKELHEKSNGVMYEAVLEDLLQRDARDSQRTVAPLRQADDALLLDASDLDADQTFTVAVDIIESIMAGHQDNHRACR